MNTADSAKVTDANAGANNAIHIPHNPTLAGLATLTRNVAYKTGADNFGDGYHLTTIHRR